MDKKIVLRSALDVDDGKTDRPMLPEDINDPLVKMRVLAEFAKDYDIENLPMSEVLRLWQRKNPLF